MAKVSDYQSALRELKAATDEWNVLHLRLGATAELMETGNPLAFLMDPIQQTKSDYLNARKPFRHSEWPLADQIAGAARRLDDAEKGAQGAWNSLSDDDKIGLSGPPTRKRA